MASISQWMMNYHKGVACLGSCDPQKFYGSSVGFEKDEGRLFSFYCVPYHFSYLYKRNKSKEKHIYIETEMNAVVFFAEFPMR